jgi:hypothetical protein
MNIARMFSTCHREWSIEMSRILKLQRLALDKDPSLFGNSCTSSQSKCCNGQANE